MTTHDQQMTGLYEEGKKLYRQRKFDESVTIFTKLAADKEYHPAGHYGLGVVNYALGKTTAAAEDFRKCLEGTPGDSLCADALHYLGQIALARRDVAGSLSLHHQALDRNPDHFGSARQVDTLERYTLKYAKALHRAKKLNESRRAFNSLVSSRNYKAAGLYGLGVIDLQRGDTAAAADSFNKCLDLHPRHANAWYYLGRIAEEKKQPEAKIREFYKRSLEINPAHAGALMRVRRLDKSVKGTGGDSPLKSHARSPKH